MIGPLRQLHSKNGGQPVENPDAFAVTVLQNQLLLNQLRDERLKYSSAQVELHNLKKTLSEKGQELTVCKRRLNQTRKVRDELQHHLKATVSAPVGKKNGKKNELIVTRVCAGVFVAFFISNSFFFSRRKELKRKTLFPSAAANQEK